MYNILVSYSKFAKSKSGGARESLLTLLNGLSQHRKISVDVFQTPPANDPPETSFTYNICTKSIQNIPNLTWTNQVFTRYQWGKYLQKQLTNNYDLLITQNILAPVSIDIATNLNIPSLFFVRSMALTGYEKFSPRRSHLSNILQTDLGGRIQYPFLRRNFYEYRTAANEATYTIANSNFTAEKIRELFGAESEVIYPPIDLENYRTEYDQNGYITMVNPRAEYKGPDIFLDIAERMSHEEFLLVGPISSAKIKRRAENLQNVHHWEWCEDMRDAYAESKLVVVPSRVEEPFGRVPAEAMVSGIPCVVSGRGGLPEVVGDTGEVVEDVNSVSKWVTAIRRAFERHNPEAQKERVQRFSAERQVAKLIGLIDDVLK